MAEKKAAEAVATDEACPVCGQRLVNGFCTRDGFVKAVEQPTE